MTKVQTPHRYYIDRDADHAVVRAVPASHVTSPATHRVEAPAVTPVSVQPLPETAARERRRARVGHLVQQAIRRRSH